MRRTLRGSYILVAQQFLDGTDIITSLNEMRGERVPQGMARRWLVDFFAYSRRFHRPLQNRLMKRLPTLNTSPWINAAL